MLVYIYIDFISFYNRDFEDAGASGKPNPFYVRTILSRRTNPCNREEVLIVAMVDFVHFMDEELFIKIVVKFYKR